MLLSLVAAVMVIAGGCYSPARRLEVSAVRRIVPGMTQRAVQERMGAPTEVVHGSSGDFVARYYFYEYHRNDEASVAGQSRQPGALLFRTLTLEYAADGRLKRKLHDESFTPIRREQTRWLEIGPKLEAESLQIRKSVDRGADLVGRLGEPMIRTLDPTGNPQLVWVYYRDRVDRLGRPVARTLIVALTSDGRVADYLLVDRPPVMGLFR